MKERVRDKLEQIDNIVNKYSLSREESILFFEALIKTENFKNFLKDTSRKIEKIPTKKNPFHTVCKEIFIQFIKANKHYDYYWTAKDSKNLNILINKIKFLLKDKYNSENTQVLFSRLLNGIKENDDWLFDKMELSIINSQFNNIVSKLQEQNKNKKIKVRPVDGGNIVLISSNEYESKKHYYKKV